MVTRKDGINFSEKKVVLRNTDFPKDMSLHVRDPKVWEENGIYYMVLGARTIDDKGCILVYKSTDLYNWEFHSVPAGKNESPGIERCKFLYGRGRICGNHGTFRFR